MPERKISKEFLDEPVRAKEFLSKKNIKLLTTYGFEVDLEKKVYTRREMNEICDIIFKLEELEDMTKKGFTPKECGMLIKLGRYDQLHASIINWYNTRDYRNLRNVLEKHEAESSKLATEDEEKTV